jgi:ABC-2 type transport system permease protein
MRSLLSMKQLTKETVFPKELLVLSSTLSSTLDFLIAMLVCVLVAYLAGVDLSWTLILLPVVVLLQFLLVVWVSLVLACLYPLARDIDHIYQVFLRALFFATPIFYTASFIGEGLGGFILMINPLAQMIELSRGMLIYGQPPAAGLVLGMALANCVLVTTSWWFFKRFEQRIAEYL